MNTAIVQVDAFTDTPFRGNPAGVCVLPAPCADDAWMQMVAAEMNLAETAFLWPQADGYSLRWFTPALEIDLCGHATIASAHVLWQDGFLPRGSQARFYTQTGLLTADQDGDWIELDFPVTPAEPIAPPADLVAALGGRPVAVSKNYRDFLVEYESEDAVRALAPDFGALARAASFGTIVTSRASTPGYDYVLRFFAPSAGIPEDPATGSVQCALAPYWQAKLGKSHLTGFQASRRTATMRVRTEGDRVKIAGQAVTVLRGTFC